MKATLPQAELTAQQKRQLQVTACNVRMDIVNMVHTAKSGHPGGSLSVADILTYLYFNRLNVDVTQPNMPNRDRLILSKGHVTPVYYSVLARKGFFPMEELTKFRKIGCMLQGHPDKKHTPGVDMSSGSLGQGFSVACGMAIAGKRSGADYSVFTIVGDGELQEGQNWEAAMFASHYGLDNLCVVVDYNNLQITGAVDQVMSIQSIKDKFLSFGFNVVTADGHNFDQIHDAFGQFDRTVGKPTAIIFHTVKGKGVSFMENSAKWHGSAPNDEQCAQAIDQLKQQLLQWEA